MSILNTQLSKQALETAFVMENLLYRHRCYTEQSTGIIRYEPERHGKSTPWSAIIEVDPDLGDYYRLLFNNHFKNPLSKPNWKAHISLFRGEDEYQPEMEQYWKERDGETVDFVYSRDIFWNNTFVWLNVYCPAYFELRNRMGLSHTHDDNELWGHITIGKFRNPGSMGDFTDYQRPVPPQYDWTY